MALIGLPAINRGWAFGTDSGFPNYSLIINLAVPATFAGEVTEVRAYFQISNSIQTIYLATCFDAGGGKYSSRDYVSKTLSTGSGLKTWSGLSLTVENADFIAIALPNVEGNCLIDASAESGGTAGWARHLGVTLPITDATPTDSDPNDKVSLEGTYSVIVAGKSRAFA